MDNVSRIMETIRKSQKCKKSHYKIEMKNAFGELQSGLDMVEETAVSLTICQQ